MAVLVYDGDCGFCQWSLRWALRLGITCEHVAGQRADLPSLGLTPDDVEAAAWYVDGDRRLRGHEAIAAALGTSRHVAVRLAGRAIGARALRPVAAPAYTWVATHRHRLPGASEACGLPPLDVRKK